MDLKSEIQDPLSPSGPPGIPKAVLSPEVRPVNVNTQNPKEFLSAMEEYPGRLAKILNKFPEMKSLINNDSKEGQSFRLDVFLRIHTQLLMQPGMRSVELFGLYEKSDMDAFIKTLTLGKTGQEAKNTETEWRQLSEAITRSHDVNYWQMQPGSNMDNFSRSLKLFQECYSNKAFSQPAVNLALKAYEKTLEEIRNANNGRVPKEFMAYARQGLQSNWDDVTSGELLKRQISMQTDNAGHFESKMYLTLAKAEGIASGRFAEIIAGKRGLIDRFITAIRNRISPSTAHSAPSMIPRPSAV